ncbi:unnamed protein product [Paramecium sonneborni]|uniref:UBC core domain-containing protein n=1 Tax=Paramecium sonneborni TaxID=65129 RepID=A0A8S1MAC3_9CILI|nr:unnamed protein product [Paramecium sonneborni]
MAKEKIKKDSEEIKNIMQEGQDNFIGEIYEIGNFQLQIWIRGPHDSPYKSYSFFLNFQFSNEYPQVPPQVTFMNKIFHPNINILGYIYLEILKDDWRIDYTIYNILMSIKSILSKPNLKYSFFPEASELYKQNKIEFEKKAKDWAEKFAIFEN